MFPPKNSNSKDSIDSSLHIRDRGLDLSTLDLKKSSLFD